MTPVVAAVAALVLAAVCAGPGRVSAAAIEAFVRERDDEIGEIARTFNTMTMGRIGFEGRFSGAGPGGCAAHAEGLREAGPPVQHRRG